MNKSPVTFVTAIAASALALVLALASLMPMRAQLAAPAVRIPDSCLRAAPEFLLRFDAGSPIAKELDGIDKAKQPERATQLLAGTSPVNVLRYSAGGHALAVLDIQSIYDRIAGALVPGVAGFAVEGLRVGEDCSLTAGDVHGDAGSQAARSALEDAVRAAARTPLVFDWTRPGEIGVEIAFATAGMDLRQSLGRRPDVLYVNPNSRMKLNEMRSPGAARGA